MKTFKHYVSQIGAGTTLALVSAQAAAAQAVGVPNPISGGDLQSVLFNVVNALLLFAGAVAVLFLIIGGFRYVVSTGNEQQVSGAKQTILYAILGLIIIFVAFVLVTLLQGWLGVRPKFAL